MELTVTCSRYCCWGAVDDFVYVRKVATRSYPLDTCAQRLFSGASCAPNDTKGCIRPLTVLPTFRSTMVHLLEASPYRGSNSDVAWRWTGNVSKFLVKKRRYRNIARYGSRFTKSSARFALTRVIMESCGFPLTSIDCSLCDRDRRNTDGTRYNRGTKYCTSFCQNISN